MKNLKFVLAMSLMIGVMLVGCGNKADQTAGEVAVWAEADANVLASYIMENTEFKDYMSAVDTDIFYGLYNLDEETAEEAVVYSSTGATAEEVAVIKATPGNGGKVEEACNARIEAQRQGFENYVPEELEKLKTPIIMMSNDTIILVVCDDSEAAKELISNYSNEEI